MKKTGGFMKKWCVVLVLSLCILVPGLASAADDSAGPKGYLALKLGGFLPNGDDDGMKDYDKVFTIGGAGGAKLLPWFAVELGVDYYSTKGNETDTYSLVFASASYSKDTKVKTWSIPLTAKFILPISKVVQPFVGAGGGWYSSKIDVDETYKVPLLNERTYSNSDSANGWGYHFVAGVDFNIMPHLALGAEVKWCKAELDFKDITDIANQLNLDNKIDYSNFNVGGTTLNFVAKYLF